MNYKTGIIALIGLLAIFSLGFYVNAQDNNFNISASYNALNVQLKNSNDAQELALGILALPNSYNKEVYLTYRNKLNTLITTNSDAKTLALAALAFNAIGNGTKANEIGGWISSKFSDYAITSSTSASSEHRLYFSSTNTQQATCQLYCDGTSKPYVIKEGKVSMGNTADQDYLSVLAPTVCDSSVKIVTILPCSAANINSISLIYFDGSSSYFFLKNIQGSGDLNVKRKYIGDYETTLYSAWALRKIGKTDKANELIPYLTTSSSLLTTNIEKDRLNALLYLAIGTQNYLSNIEQVEVGPLDIKGSFSSISGDISKTGLISYALIQGGDSRADNSAEWLKLQSSNNYWEDISKSAMALLGIKGINSRVLDIECTSTPQCPKGRVCGNNLRCIEQCSSETVKQDCGSKYCVDGGCSVCLPETSTDIQTFDTGCGASKKYCVDYACYVCKENTDCGEGKKCDRGVCKDECSKSTDCAQDEACKAGRCLTKCTSNNDCFGYNEICSGGACITACQDDSQCGTGMKCENSMCVAVTQALTFKIYGRITLEDGTVLEDVDVSIQEDATKTTKTNSSGDYVLENIPSGEINLITYKEGYINESQSLYLESDMMDINFQLRAGVGCITNLECGSGEICERGECITQPAGCTSNLDCAEGETCQDGICIVSGAEEIDTEEEITGEEEIGGEITQPAEEETSAWWIVLLIFLVLILAGGGGFLYYIKRTKKSPKEAFGDIINLIKGIFRKKPKQKSFEDFLKEKESPFKMEGRRIEKPLQMPRLEPKIKEKPKKEEEDELEKSLREAEKLLHGE